MLDYIILSEEETDIIIKLYESGQTLKEISSNIPTEISSISNIAQIGALITSIST